MKRLNPTVTIRCPTPSHGTWSGHGYGGPVPLIYAVVCPHPPVLIPEIAAGAASELHDLRRACDVAVGELLGAGAETVVLLGAGDRTRRLPADAYATFAPFGVSIEFSLAAAGGATDPAARLPLSLAVGAWLLARRSHALPVEAISVAGDAGEAECARLAASLRDRSDRVALLVMGDGTACRVPQPPGHDDLRAGPYDDHGDVRAGPYDDHGDPRAGPYDDAVARALAGADADALSGLDPELSAELSVAGRAPWQVLAGCAGNGWRGHLSYYAAPYGVAYFVARWDRP